MSHSLDKNSHAVAQPNAVGPWGALGGLRILFDGLESSVLRQGASGIVAPNTEEASVFSERQA